MTTTEYRLLAKEAEINMQWSVAAELWEKAINVYPSNGSLAELDISKMKSSKMACEKMVGE